MNIKSAIRLRNHTGKLRNLTLNQICIILSLDDYITISDLAEKTKLSPRTVQKLLFHKKYKIVKSRDYYPRHSVADPKKEYCLNGFGRKLYKLIKAK